MVQVLMAATPIYGHVAPLVTIAADLRRRGTTVTFVTGNEFASQVQASGARFVPLPNGGVLSPARLADYFQERAALPPGPPQLDLDIRRLFVGPMPHLHAALQEQLHLLGSDEPVVVLHDTTFTGLWPVLLGAPGIRPAGTVGLGVIPLTISSTDTAPFGLGLPPDASSEGRARNAGANAAVREMFAPAEHFTDRTLQALGATAATPFPIDAMVTLPDRFLQLTPPGVEYPRSDAPAGLRFVGALPAPPDADRRPLPAWFPDLDEADRVVVVTQGTLANRDLGELVEPTLAALADLDVLVVATTGRDDATVRNVPSNARIASFVPYSLLLPFTDVLVTNGGYGGALQSLGHGVPLVLAGVSEEKVEVTARLAWTGAAINLETGHPTPEAIRAAAEKVLDDASYARAARALQAENSRLDPLAAVADTVLELAHRTSGSTDALVSGVVR